jgi:hypothetical protein
MRKLITSLAVTAALAAPTLAAMSPASARGGDVKVAGTCTGRSTSTLKLAPRTGDNITQVEFEVDTNRAGVTWRVRVTDHGNVVIARLATTNAGGSFTVQKRLPGAKGHVIAARARNLTTGEVCTASASV